ncbi:type II secretion system protein [Gemella sp. GH3]|uniref:type II secretion system protein n=1 Tax=unclassified Gemella TaxID=2624949 RepID=UPI0015D0CB02|nr:MULTISPECIES: type II secretion system protein [unclassified Gemella]MBF0713231.1 type II secretion system protein [Gemella sp. GH3.1]NYS50183.1 type II secretion system protein [Gemella sp. GH3]
MKNNSGFTLLEVLVGIFICSIILIFLIPNLVLEYENLTDMEQKLELKCILYEEITINDNKEFELIRDNYKIVVTENRATIENLVTGDFLEYK